MRLLSGLLRCCSQSRHKISQLFSLTRCCRSLLQPLPCMAPRHLQRPPSSLHALVGLGQLFLRLAVLLCSFVQVVELLVGDFALVLQPGCEVHESVVGQVSRDEDVCGLWGRRQSGLDRGRGLGGSGGGLDGWEKGGLRHRVSLRRGRGRRLLWRLVRHIELWSGFRPVSQCCYPISVYYH